MEQVEAEMRLERIRGLMARVFTADDAERLLLVTFRGWKKLRASHVAGTTYDRLADSDEDEAGTKRPGLFSWLFGPESGAE